MPEGGLTAFAVCDEYPYFAGQEYLLTSQSRKCTEYLIPTDKIVDYCLIYTLTL